MTGGFLGWRSLRSVLAWLGTRRWLNDCGVINVSPLTGALVGAALMGVTGYLRSYQLIFRIVVLLGLPLFLALRGPAWPMSNSADLAERPVIMLRVASKIRVVDFIQDFRLVVFGCGPIFVSTCELLPPSPSPAKFWHASHRHTPQPLYTSVPTLIVPHASSH